jgi:hypothetical protein
LAVGVVVSTMLTLSLLLGAVAQAGTNLLPNGDFEGNSTAGWKASNATLSIVSPGSGSTYALKVAHSTTSTSYQVYASPKPVTNATQGAQYTGDGQVMGLGGRSICLALRETTPGGTQVQKRQSCVTASGGWDTFATVNLTVQTSGDSVGFQITQTAAQSGDSFEVDNLDMESVGAPPPPTFAALWHMDEASGSTMVDSSGNGNDGTLQNVTRVSPGFDGTGKAYQFNGTSSYVSVPNSASLNPGSADITISFYLNTTTLPTQGDYDLVRKGVYTGQEYKIELLQSGQITCVFRGSTNHFNATGGSGLTNGSWHHIQCIKTSSQVQLLIDGTVIKTTNGTVGSISNSDGVYIGAHPGNDFYNGLLDEVSISTG